MSISSIVERTGNILTSFAFMAAPFLIFLYVAGQSVIGPGDVFMVFIFGMMSGPYFRLAKEVFRDHK